MKRSCILVIDHDVVSHILVSEALSGRDIEIVHAENGREAINLFRYSPFFDLVITELLLPDMDGFNVLKELRELNPIVPIIAQTAFAEVDIKERCIKEGFNFFLEKPTSVDVIVNNVEKFKNYVNI